MDESPSRKLYAVDGSTAGTRPAHGDARDLRRFAGRADVRHRPRAIGTTRDESTRQDPMDGTPDLGPIRAARYRTVWIIIGLIGLAAIVYVHLTGGPHHLLTFHPNADKLEHVFAFGAAMLWFGQLYRRGAERSLVCLCLILGGIVLEYVQHALGHYDPVEYGDMAADAVGASLGWLLLRTRLDHLIERMDSWLARRRAG